MPPLEPPGFICNIDPTWPLGSDNVSQGDDHFRNFKKSVKDSFPNICGPVTVSQDDINTLPVPSTVLNPINAGVTLSQSWSIPQTSTWVTVPFDTVEYDTDEHFPPLAPTIFTAKYTGVHIGNALVNGRTFGDGQTLGLGLLVNGTDFKFLGDRDSAKNSNDLAVPGGWQIPLTAGDTVEVQVRTENSNRSIDAGAYFQMAFLR